MPPLNVERRNALADAAIRILARSGAHGLSHRSVDEEANVPNGTTSNYFRSRDALLEATLARIIEQHLEWLADLRGSLSGPITRAQVINVLVSVVERAVTDVPERYLARFELALESGRRSELHKAQEAIAAASMGFLVEAHSGADVHVDEQDVQLLNAFYNGVLFNALVVPGLLGKSTPGELTRLMLERVLR